MSIEGLNELSLAFGELFKTVIPANQHAAVKKVALAGYVGMVKKTPVDTGRARANWSVSINVPAGADGYDKQPYGSPPDRRFEMPNAMTAEKSQPLDTIYVTNNLPYILALEEGHSKQGSHMVELTVNELKRHYGI